ncbi:unnamed protein product, partial [marine sediment metagenome]
EYEPKYIDQNIIVKKMLQTSEIIKFKQGLINPLINSTKTKTNKIAIPKN